jgi:hypothetical protein
MYRKFTMQQKLVETGRGKNKREIYNDIKGPNIRQYHGILHSLVLCSISFPVLLLRRKIASKRWKWVCSW